MKTEMTKVNIKKFKELFKKGEQVFVGFRDGETHGYITTINDYGFGLSQINNSIEKLYSWDHFELVCTSGFRIKKAKAAEEAILLNIVKKVVASPTTYPIPNLNNITNRFISDMFIVNNTGLKKEELSIGPKQDQLCVKITGGKGYIKAEKGIGIQSFPCKGRIETMEYHDLVGEFLFLEKKDCHTRNLVLTKKEVAEFRENSWKEIVYCGDPWRIEDIIKSTDFIFESKQGFCLVNFNGIIMF